MQVCNLPHNISDITKLQLSETKRRYMPLFFKVVLCFEPKIVSKVKFTFFAALKQWSLSSLTKQCMGYKYKSKTSSQNCKKIRKDTLTALYHFLCTRKWDVWLKLTDLIWDHLDKTDFLPQPVKLKALRINWSAWAIRTEKALAYFGGFWICPFLGKCHQFWTFPFLYVNTYFFSK